MKKAVVVKDDGNTTFAKIDRQFTSTRNVHRRKYLSTVRKWGIAAHLGRVWNTVTLQSLKTQVSLPIFLKLHLTSMQQALHSSFR